MSELVRWIPDGAQIVSTAVAAGPEHMTIAQYQEAVGAQISSDAAVDSDTATIGAYPPEIYFYLGAREEYAETWEYVEPTRYDRGATLRPPRPAERLPVAVDDLLYHAKEFGDLSWYVANTLNWYDIALVNAIGVPEYCTVRQLDDVALGWSVEFPAIFASPADFFDASASRFLTASEVMLQRAERAQAVELAQAAGQLIVATSTVLQLRLGAKLAAVWAANLRKIERRIGAGNIFSSGGDAR